MSALGNESTREGGRDTHVLDMVAALHGARVAAVSGGGKDNEGEGRGSGETGEHDVQVVR